VLLEQYLAIELNERKRLRKIFPLFVGDVENGDGKYGDYFKQECLPNRNETVINSVVEKAQLYLEKMGLGQLQNPNMSVSDIVDKITGFQGFKVMDKSLLPHSKQMSSSISITEPLESILNRAKSEILRATADVLSSFQRLDLLVTEVENNDRPEDIIAVDYHLIRCFRELLDRQGVKWARRQIFTLWLPFIVMDTSISSACSAIGDLREGDIVVIPVSPGSDPTKNWRLLLDGVLSLSGERRWDALHLESPRQETSLEDKHLNKLMERALYVLGIDFPRGLRLSFADPNSTNFSRSLRDVLPEMKEIQGRLFAPSYDGVRIVCKQVQEESRGMPLSQPLEDLIKSSSSRSDQSVASFIMNELKKP
jgi:hypothetical protein